MSNKTYIFSKYNYIIDLKKCLIIKNTLTDKYLVVRENNYSVFKQTIESPDLNKEKILQYPFLINNGFFVENKENEYIKAIKKYDDECESHMLHLTIIPTNSCNLRCIYCFQNKSGKHMSIEESNILLKYINKNINNYSGIIVSWFGGEPLLNPQFIINFMDEIKKICKSKRKPFFSNITTNGVNLKADIFKKLINNHVIQYQITLDGFKDIHDLQRPHMNSNISSFELIINNLRCIRDLVNPKTFNIGLRINVSKINIEFIYSFIDFLYNEFGSHPSFSLILEKVNDWGGDRIASNKQILLNEDSMNDVKKYAINKGFNLEKQYSKNASYICNASYKNSFVVRYDLNVYKCSFSWDNEKQDTHNLIGKIDNNGDLILDIEKNELWSKTYKTDEKCVNCVHYPECFGVSCPLTYFFNNKAFNCKELFKNYDLDIINYVKNNYENIDLI